MALTQEDIDYLKKQGLDPDSFQPTPAEEAPTMSKAGAVGATLKGHAGGILGGSVGVLGTGTLLAPWLLGPEAGIPADILMMGGAALGGAGGGLLGQKAQQAIQSNETNQAQQEQLEQAQQQHPLVSMGTDIAASAIASGGSPSIRTPLAALRGDTGALRNIALQSVVNPAINSGIDLATTGQLPSSSDMAAQAFGGALFSGYRNPLGRLYGHSPLEEPTDKNNVPNNIDNETPQLNAPKQPVGLLGRGSRFLGGDEGGPIVDVYSQEVPHPDKMGEQQPTESENQNATPIRSDTGQTEETRNVNTGSEEARSDDIQQQTPEQPKPVEERTQEQEPLSDEERKELSNMDLNPESGSIGGMSKGANAIKDWADYQEAGKRMDEAEPGSDAFMQAWKDREAVKNRTDSGRPRGSTPTDPAVQAPNKGITGESGFFRLPFFTKSVVDRVSDIPHPGAKEIATGAKKALNEQDQLRGQYKNPIVEAGSKLSKTDMNRINEIKNKEMSTGQLHPPTAQDNPAVRNYYAIAKDRYSKSGDYAINNNIPVMDSNGTPRLMKKDPAHWAGMANQRVEDIYRKNTDQVAINKLDTVFDNWNQKDLGMTPQASKVRIANLKIALQGDLRGSDVSHQDYFNALRKAQGSPLPPEFRENNPVKNDARYFDRFSVAASHYKHMEANPKIQAALGVSKDAWGKDIPQIYKEGGLANNPDVKNLLHQFHSTPEDSAERRERSFSGIATSALISGPPLEVHKLVSNEVKALSFARNPIQVVNMLAHGLTHLKEGYIHAKENGLVKLTANSVSDVFSGTATAAEKMNGIARAIRQVSTLGDLTTKFNAGLLQSQMEYIIPAKIHSAEHGNVTDQKFLQNLDPDYRVGKWYTPKEQQKLASLAASYIHGTGDIRQMPGWMLNDGEVSGFFNLAHWSVAQTNNFVHDVLEPAQRGDVVPLLTSVFGAAVGGYLIKELRQDISGKKNPIPSVQEIQSGEGGLAAHKSLLAYNLIAAMQYSGFGGLLSQVAKYPFDFAYKNQPQGATFPLDELATDLASTIHNVSSAIANDPNVNWIDLAATVGQHTLQNNMMLSRIAINQGINSGLITGLPAEKKALADKMNRLRRFDEVQGLPYNDIDEGSNPYMNLEQKKFKYDENPQEAMQMLPSLVSGIMSAYAGKPDVIMSKLKGLKQNQYSTFPSMEDMPIEFMKYLGYLSKMEGPDAAQGELMDYMKHKAINTAKASAVP